jgi:hypothetical protein
MHLARVFALSFFAVRIHYGFVLGAGPLVGAAAVASVVSTAVLVLVSAALPKWEYPRAGS